MIQLPPLRRKIFFDFLKIVLLFALLGAALCVAVFLAGRAPPQLIHMNYDSISVSSRMTKALLALAEPELFPDTSRAQWAAEFENALALAESNATETGEAQSVAAVRDAWEGLKADELALDSGLIRSMTNELDTIIRLNEVGMFHLAERNASIARVVLGVCLAAVLLGVLLALLASDRASQRISEPLRQIASTLRSRPTIGQRLNLPTPSSLEMKAFVQELRELWKRVEELNRASQRLLDEERNKLGAMLSAVEDGILFLDNDDHVLHCNDSFQELLGIPDQDIIGDDWNDLDCVSANYMALKRFTADRDLEAAVESLAVQESRRSFQLKKSRVVDDDGDQQGRVVLLRQRFEAAESLPVARALT